MITSCIFTTDFYTFRDFPQYFRKLLMESIVILTVTLKKEMYHSIDQFEFPISSNSSRGF